MAPDAKGRKQNKYWEQVESSVSGYNKIKKEYELSINKMEEYLLTNLTINQFDFSPHSVSGKKERWQKNAFKEKRIVVPEEYLMMMTTIFETYKKMTKVAAVLTMQMIETRQGHHYVAIGGATAIVHDHSTDTNVPARDAVLAI